jgi:hypothetical protein
MKMLVQTNIQKLLSVKLLLLFPILGFSQNNILLNEQGIDRPLLMHKNQIQVNTNYTFGYTTKKFDGNGNAVDLLKVASASLMQTLQFESSYGISENLQILLGVNYKSTELRNLPVETASEHDYLLFSQITDKKGLDDLLMELSFQIPTAAKKLYLSFNLGTYIPVASYTSQKPEHLYLTTDTITYLSYLFNEKNGDGVFKLKSGLSLKLRTKKFAFIGAATYIQSLGQADKTRWIWQLTGNGIGIYSFNYDQIPYHDKPSQQIDYNLCVLYQVVPWIHLLGYFKSLYAFNGWSENTGQRIKNIETHLNYISLGIELQATPNLRLYQDIEYAISGKNINAPYIFNTGVSLNFMHK